MQMLACARRLKLDKAARRASNPTMRNRNLSAGVGRRVTARAAMSLTTLLSMLALAGCSSETAAHVKALAISTAPVVDEAAATYAGANAIHAMRTDLDAATAFDAPPPAAVYNPRTVPPLLSEDAIKARLKVLAAFQAYVQSLEAIANDTDTPQMQAAAKSAGAGLADMTNSLAPSVEAAFGLAQTVPTTVTTVTTTSSGTIASVTQGATNPISTTTQNIVSTGIDALEQFLVQRRLKKDLPKIVNAMDPKVKQLCDLLANDITNLKVIEMIDYNYVIDHQTLFLRENDGKMDRGIRRMLITKLPVIAREQRTSDGQLTQLTAAILNLELTHHAFAADLQGNNPASIKQKLTDLEAAGTDLGKFYSSL